MHQLTLTPLDEIRALHSEIISCARTTLDKAIRIGELLTAQKASLKHGQWLPWVEENLPFSHNTASRYMGVYLRRDEISHNGKFELTDAYRLLSAPSEPEPDLFSESSLELAGERPAAADAPNCEPGQSESVVHYCKDCGTEIDSRAAHFTGKCKDCHGQSRTISPEPADRPHVAQNSGENEWYTPAEYIEAAHSVMGRITLDPASCELANETVKAEQFYTKEDDGLAKEWRGNVWMNPPYAQPLIGQFSEKLASELTAANVKSACVLVNNATETTWFQRMASLADAVCFPRGRVRFIDPNGNPGAPLQGQAVLYFGGKPGKFKTVFQKFGLILTK